MDPFNKHKKVSVVFIPDYIKKTMEARGLTLEMLDKHVGEYSGYHNAMINLDNINKWFKNNMSSNDITDLVLANDIFTNNVLRIHNLLYKANNDKNIGTLRYLQDELPSLVGYNIKDTNYKEFISLYCNPNIDINSIIMSRTNSEENAVWSTVVTEHTIFIILHEGFTNFIVYNIKEFKEVFTSSLVDSIFKMFREDTVVNSSIFKSFIRL